MATSLSNDKVLFLLLRFHFLDLLGVPGSANNQLFFPYDISVDFNSGTLYVADSSNNRIMAYPSGVLTGTVAAGNNGAGTASNQLNGPYCVHFDAGSNSLIIVNYNAHNVVRWVIGGSTWTLLVGVTGVAGFSNLHLHAPRDVILDSMGNIYVADSANHRVQFFKAGESNGTTIAGVTSSPGPASNQLNTPYGIALDSQFNLYVADTSNYRIQKFQRI